MTGVYRLKLKPTSPWRTPWHADTLSGMLLATAARVLGARELRERLIDPMLAGAPPFVLSDALPGESLPFPIHLRLADWSDEFDLKAVKHARWLAPTDFQLARSGSPVTAGAMLADDQVFLRSTRQHNTLSRLTGSSLTGDDGGGGIYQRSETLLRSAEDAGYLSIYFRVADHSSGDLLLELFHELSLTGFGADTSTGRGQFNLPQDPTPARGLDSLMPAPDAVLCLSTFQPAPGDPTDGFWEAFPKFGKLAPGLGLTDVRKHTLILFRPGACFRSDQPRPFLGHAIDTQRLVPPDAARSLLERNLRVIHPAFGLTIPATLPQP